MSLWILVTPAARLQQFVARSQAYCPRPPCPSEELQTVKNEIVNLQSQLDETAGTSLPMAAAGLAGLTR